MGRIKRKAIASLLTALAVCAAGSTALQIWRSGEAGGQEPVFHHPYLTIHGPNDGEPLNNSVELRLDVAVAMRARVIVYQGNRYIATTPVIPSNEGVQTLVFPIDSTTYPNGPFSLSFYLFSDQMDVLMDSASFDSRIANPSLDVSGQRLGQNLVFKLRGRAGDAAYRIEAGRNLEDLTRVPQDTEAPRAVTVVGSGEFPISSIGGAFEHTESIDIVLNVDALIREQTLDSFLVLWTGDLLTGKWAHSKPLALRSLPAPEAPLRRAQHRGDANTTYRR